MKKTTNTETENSFITVVKKISPCSSKEIESTKIALEPIYLLNISKVLV